MERAATNRPLQHDLARTLHAGESAAIALAAEIGGAILLIDDAEGRRVAEQLGIRVTGTVGVLLAAKKRGHLQAVAPIVADLRDRAHFWVTDDVVRRALQLAGE